MNLSIELLTPARVLDLRSKLEPLLKQACEGNPIAAMTQNADNILHLAQTDQAVIFVGFDSGRVSTVLALQFIMVGGRKGAEIIAMSGRNLIQFKNAFWKPILDWLRANSVEFMDAYAPPRLADLYLTKFGFDQSCTMVRMTLAGGQDE